MDIGHFDAFIVILTIIIIFFGPLITTIVYTLIRRKYINSKLKFIIISGCINYSLYILCVKLVDFILPPKLPVKGEVTSGLFFRNGAPLVVSVVLGIIISLIVLRWFEKKN